VGIFAPGPRKLPGLRREEVAELAHLGIAWYTWLEQARDIKVSDEVLSSIASALRLNANERAYLLTIGHSPRLDRQRSDEPPIDRDSQQLILGDLYPSPAYIRDEHWNVLSWNRGFGAIAHLESIAPRERNLLRLIFTDKASMDLQVDWERTASFAVAQFRFECGRRLQDPELVEMIDELHEANPLFEMLWQSQEVHSGVGTRAEWRDPDSDKLVFDRAVYAVPSAADPGMINGPRHRLSVYVPVRGTQTSERLRERWDHEEYARPA
jgi:transcriptional regulator with XRE-family HTH domain